MGGRFLQPVSAVPARVDVLAAGDCRELLPRLTEGSVALTHTSPPYNIGRKYAGFRDRQDVDRYLELIAAVATQLFRVTREGGSVFWQVGYTGYGHALNGESAGIKLLDALSLPLFEDAGFRLWDRIIWNYYGSMAFKSKFTNRHESILWLVKPTGRRLAPTFDLDAVRERSKSYDGRNHILGRNPGNVWYAERVAFGATGQTSHIAVFPEEVSEKIVRAASAPGDLVLDPFAGSGTLPKVARSLGRRFIGAEIVDQYLRDADRRLRLWAPFELENLAVGLLVKYGFHAQPESKPIRYLIDVLNIHVMEKRRSPLLLELQSAVEEIRTASRVTPSIKRRKAELWERFDRLIRASDESDAIIAADRSLAFGFAHRKQWNGVRRYLSAGVLLENLRHRIEKVDGPERFIELLCHEADERFRIERRNVRCLSSDPGLGCAEAGLRPSTHSIQEEQLFAR
jgi:adenine-specific DNA-methyltransferase